MTYIKVCGLTREADIRQAAALGAWACGFILTESPRRVSAARARELAAYARRALPVGVFGAEPADLIAAMADEAGVICVQLCAGPDGPSVAEVRTATQERGTRPRIIAAADAPDAADADFVLFDSREPGRYGGTGRPADWEAAAAVPGANYRLLLAGGLTPVNVGAAVARVRPLAVDVSSGVESAPGEKDQELLFAFFSAVAEADMVAARPRSSPTPGAKSEDGANAEEGR